MLEKENQVDFQSENVSYIYYQEKDNTLEASSVCVRNICREAVIYFSHILMMPHLKDFFPSIAQKDVFNIFYQKGYTKKVSYYLAKLLTKDGVLPQGSPASPKISNIVAKHLDKRLSELAKCYDATYSRYADDLTFSGASNIKNMIPIITQIIQEEAFSVNEKKTRYSYHFQRQEVTGLIVNKKVSIPKEYLREVNKEIYYCKKYGVSSHLKKTDNHKSFYKEYMYGKAYFINMIDKEIGQKVLCELDAILWEY